MKQKGRRKRIVPNEQGRGRFRRSIESVSQTSYGRGPLEIRTTFCKHWVICGMEGNLSPVKKFSVRQICIASGQPSPALIIVYVPLALGSGSAQD
ncbi:Na-translocating system protein MpsC family protein [Paenibacillus sp. MZ04-78.2]|uniref:Na-translocating system protein MpsC family protein n=1 Tax=Paenibacillus sp. MZ04-78.2 TaxID=2962034 RepID=UPI0035CB4FAB